MAGQDVSGGTGRVVIRGWRKWLILMLRLAFGVLLLVASFDKIRYPYAFAEAVENYLVVGEGLSRWVAVWLPYVEALVGLGLILGVWLDTVSAMNAMLMLVFLILVSQAYVRGLDIRCGCFFVDGESKIGLLKITENLIYAGFSVVLLCCVWKRNRRSA